MVAVTSAKPAVPNDDKRWRIVETRMRRLGNRPDAVVEALHSAQEAFGYIDDDALRFVSDTLSVPPSRVFGVATFYHISCSSRRAPCLRGLHRHGLLHQRSWSMLEGIQERLGSIPATPPRTISSPS